MVGEVLSRSTARRVVGTLMFSSFLVGAVPFCGADITASSSDGCPNSETLPDSSGLTVYLSGSSFFETSDLSDGDALAEWLPCSPFLQPTVMEQPVNTLRPIARFNATPGGIPAVEFDGADDFMFSDDGDNWFGNTTGGVTVFAVVAEPGGTAPPQPRTVISQGFGTGDFEFKLAFALNAFDGPVMTRETTTTSVPVSTYARGSWIVISSFLVNGTGNGEVFVNGTLLGGNFFTGTPADSGVPTTVGAALIDGTASAQQNYFEGQISELLVFDRQLTSLGRQRYECWLGERHQITVTNPQCP
jgi:hypothetical protein